MGIQSQPAHNIMKLSVMYIYLDATKVSYNYSTRNVPVQMQMAEQNTSRQLFLYTKLTFQHKPQAERKKHLWFQ